MEVVLKPTIRTNMHICVPVLIPCPIPGLIWVLSSYISSAMGVILVYSRTNMYICAPVLILCPILGLIWVLSLYISTAKGVILAYILTNMNICVPVLLLYPILGLLWLLSSYISSATGVILVYCQYVLWASDRWLFHNCWLRGIPSLQHLMVNKIHDLLVL